MSPRRPTQRLSGDLGLLQDYIDVQFTGLRDLLDERQERTDARLDALEAAPEKRANRLHSYGVPIGAVVFTWFVDHLPAHVVFAILQRSH